MGKYDPLQVYLQGLPAGVAEKTLTFVQIERIIGAALPRSARQYPAWWANERAGGRHVQAKAWLAAGWRVQRADQEREWVRFERE